MSWLSDALSGHQSNQKAAAKKRKQEKDAQQAADDAAAAAKNQAEQQAKAAQDAINAANQRAAASAAAAQQQFADLVSQTTDTVSQALTPPEPKAPPLSPDSSVSAAKATYNARKRKASGLTSLILSPLGGGSGKASLGA